jgi:hypothetical protein
MEPPRRLAVLQSWEPALADMLADPVIQAMMRVDGVRMGEVLTLMREARERLGAASQDS